MPHTGATINDYWSIDGAMHKLPSLSIDLQRQFSGGRDDEHLRALLLGLTGPLHSLIQHSCNDRQQKGSLHREEGCRDVREPTLREPILSGNLPSQGP